MLIGYALVPTVDQDIDLQRNALTEAGYTRVFTEQISGAVTDCPEPAVAIGDARSGDTVVVWNFDSLARFTRDLLKTPSAIAERRAGFRSRGDAWADTITPHVRLIFTVLGGLANFERELIRARAVEDRAVPRRRA